MATRRFCSVNWIKCLFGRHKNHGRSVHASGQHKPARQSLPSGRWLRACSSLQHCPTQDIAAVRLTEDGEQRELSLLHLVDGFYEWQKVDGTKQPFFIHRPDDKPFAFAGLWEYWTDEGQEIQSCTIITTTANSLMEPLQRQDRSMLSN